MPIDERVTSGADPDIRGVGGVDLLGAKAALRHTADGGGPRRPRRPVAVVRFERMGDFMQNDLLDDGAGAELGEDC